MSNSSNRNPKVLKEFIPQQQKSQLEMSHQTFQNSNTTTSHQALLSNTQSTNEQLEETMKNLKNLSAEEKTEIGLLKSRIEEQSRLIMILKQRGDDYITKNMTLERLNQELNDKKEQLERDLKTAQSKYADLEDKFKYLGENHEALIRFKDEYKERVGVLERENKVLIERLKQTKLVGESEDEERRRVAKRLESAESKLIRVEEKCQNLTNELEKAKTLVSDKELALRAVEKEIDGLRSKNRELITNNQEFLETVEKLKHNIFESNQNSEKKLDALAKEKHEIALTCEALKKEKQNLLEANEKIDKNYKSICSELNKLKDKYSKEPVNEKLMEANLRYENLEKYFDLMKEFQAYKKYANDLLDREKELNNKYRLILN